MAFMTEQEWQRATEPSLMLRLWMGEVPERKACLFAVACCRRIWGLLPNDEFRELIRAAERHIEGAGTQDELEAVTEAAHGYRSLPLLPAALAAYEAARCYENAFYHARNAARLAGRAVNVSRSDAEKAAQADLLRDIAGPLPFRAIALERRVVTPAIAMIAAPAYEERDLPSGHLDDARLAVLADALEEAGITGEVPEHLRTPGPHVRGCWALDLVIGKDHWPLPPTSPAPCRV
jgi:hypothetical protein